MEHGIHGKPAVITDKQRLVRQIKIKNRCRMRRVEHILKMKHTLRLEKSLGRSQS